MNEPAPQNERSVALRALCIGALLKRHELEMRVKTLQDYLISDEDRAILISKRHRLNQELLAWLEHEALLPHLTQAEKHLLNLPLGTWTARMLLNVSWRAETLGVLLWALYRLEALPHYDTPFEQERVLAPLDVFASTIDFVWCARLRPTAELQRMRDTAELWDWRAKVMALQRLGVRPNTHPTFNGIVRSTAEQALQAGKVTHLIDHDLPAFGKAYASLSDDQYDLVRTIAQERTTALGWLSERTVEWVSIPID